MTVFSSLYTARLDTELATDDTAELFTTARRKAAINRGVQEFADLTECFTRVATATITGGTAEYALSSSGVIADGDFVRFAKETVTLTYTDAAGNVTVVDDLQRRDPVWLDRFEPGWRNSTVSTATGQQLPRYYYERMDGGARVIGFSPTPSTGSSATLTAAIPYVAYPPVLVNDSDEPYSVSTAVRTDLRPFHQAPVHYAAHVLEKLRRDTQESGAQYQQFLAYVEKFKAGMRRKGGNTISVARSYFRRATDEGTDPRR